MSSIAQQNMAIGNKSYDKEKRLKERAEGKHITTHVADNHLFIAVVSRAFQILSDSDKKAKYDKFGGDPESRFGAGGGGPSAPSASPFSGFAQRPGPRQNGMWEEEISPEDLFRQFFGGGGMGGGPFGGAFGKQLIFT